MTNKYPREFIYNDHGRNGSGEMWILNKRLSSDERIIYESYGEGMIKLPDMSEWNVTEEEMEARAAEIKKLASGFEGEIYLDDYIAQYSNYLF